MKQLFKNKSQTTRLGLAFSFLAILGWGLAILAIKGLEIIFDAKTDIDLTHFVIIPACLVLIAIFVNLFEFYKRFNINPKLISTVLTSAHGLWAMYVGFQVHPLYNGFLLIILFFFGMYYLSFSHGFRETILFTIFHLLFAVSLILALDVEFGHDESIFLAVLVFHGLSSSFANELNERKRRQIKNEISRREHSYRQLKKICYPHQLDQIARGEIIEDTMPVKRGPGCCVLFKIVNSESIKHEQAEKYFRQIFGVFSEILLEKGDEISTYRVVELNSKFVFTVGFPFRGNSTELPSRSSLVLALKLMALFERSIEELGYPEPIDCCVTIASGEMEGFYSKGIPIEYHIHGEPLVILDRLEELGSHIRKKHEKKGPMIVIHERVFNSLQPTMRSMFSGVSSESSSVLRDAGKVYYAYLGDADHNSVGPALTPREKDLAS